MLLIRILALPILPIYALVILIRNWSFDKGWLVSNQFDIPVIGIGNLSVGGTGKTPHTEYLIRLLKDQYTVSVISRGYKRSTKGYLEVQKDHMAIETGDEPLQMKRKFPEAFVAVAEERINGITNVLIDHEEIDVILLDDAFQHRQVRPGVNILLSTYSDPFYKDKLLPFGNLREFRKGATRADYILVSKCPMDLSSSQQETIRKEIKAYSQARVFFTYINYGEIRNATDHTVNQMMGKCVLVTGIANPEPLVEHLKQKGIDFKHMAFRDHHNFSKNDLEKIKDLFDTFEAQYILCTEKDAVRMMAHTELLTQLEMPIAYQEISVAFLDNGASDFNKEIDDYVRKNKDNHRVSE